MATDAATAGVNWLTTLLTMQGLTSTVTAHPVEDESGESCWLTIAEEPLSPEQVQALIGDGGTVLDSIQYLANTTLNLGKEQADQQAFTIELAGYRAKRLEELKAMAAEAAERVLASGEKYEMQGLSSAERRQMHHFLAAQDGLSTFSRGREPDRRLVVCLAGQQDDEATDG
ncbi:MULTISPECIES: R3H domain-containing nucleic acid-binding protein [Cyanophyceae]|uniref:Jag family protein n=1 Tax=Cyanophyceae TaxID=3028117 RepID=UPI0016882F27|nr:MULTISPECIES: R3H domain-containing nucleic acid-binding protein [Cyanophyceae]MBD1914987.1 RNA-binding protein [Phormidium sp. FACHB-77]MBD2032774.1 RNA-binding protein [Phormidium sp. FACHB-322]MBD2049919.1 RNA-binding protein [Leptolyngbya sp. FACHB-60]